MSGKKKTIRPKPPMPFNTSKKQKLSHPQQKPKLTKSPSVITKVHQPPTLSTKSSNRPVSPRALRRHTRAAQRQQQIVTQLSESGAVTHIPKKRQHKPPTSAGKSKPRPQHKTPSSSGKSKSKPTPKPSKPTPKPKTKPTPKPTPKPRKKRPSKVEPDDSAYDTDSDDDIIADNTHNTNDSNAPPPPPPPPPSPINTQQQTRTPIASDTHRHMIAPPAPPNQHMIDALAQSQSYPASSFFTNNTHKQVSFSPTKRVNPLFSFTNQLTHSHSTTQHKSDTIPDSAFLFEFNNEDAPTPTNAVQPIADIPLFQGNSDPLSSHQHTQPIQNPHFTAFLSQQTAILSQLANLMVNKSSSYQQKQPVDLLGHNIKNCLQSRGDYVGYPLQRLTITSNKAHAYNKNVAPSQKKVVAFTSAFEVLNVLQTFQAIKCEYTGSLIKKLEQEKIDVLTRLNNGTLLPIHITNFTNDSTKLSKLLSDELIDFERSTSLVADIFAFSKLKEVTWIWQAAFIQLMKSHGRAKISSSLLNAGLLDAIPSSAVFDKTNNNSTATPSRGNKKTCWFVSKFGSCNNKSPQHRQQFVHPKFKPQNRPQNRQPNQQNQQNQQDGAPQPPNAGN